MTQGILRAMSGVGKQFVDYYALLLVSPSATEGEVRAAYMSLAKSLHPDVNGGDAAQMQTLNQAYQTLRDDSKRRAYDLMHQAETGTEKLQYRYDTTGDSDTLISSMSDEEVDDFLNSVVSDFRAENPPKNPLHELKTKISFTKKRKSETE